jgi:hypothetical protein
VESTEAMKKKIRDLEKELELLKTANLSISQEVSKHMTDTSNSPLNRLKD